MEEEERRTKEAGKQKDTRLHGEKEEQKQKTQKQRKNNKENKRNKGGKRRQKKKRKERALCCVRVGIVAYSQSVSDTRRPLP